MKRILLCVSLGTLGLCAVAQTTPVLEINVQNHKAVTPIEYGWHYEEIGMIGEGGLYAEMVRNRGLEEANMPPGLEVVNGKYANIPRPDEPEKKVYVMDPLVGWKSYPAQTTAIHLTRTDVSPLNSQNPHSLQVEVKKTAGNTGVCNEGFFGMSLKKGNTYKLSLYARGNKDFTGGLTVALMDSLGVKLSTAFTIKTLQAGWKKYEATLTATQTTTHGKLVCVPTSTGTFFLDVVSLFPGDTWDGGKSVFRADILQNLKDFQPDFLRFPGGCIIHGVNVETMYHWKETIGDIAQRPGAWSKWEPHYRTDGLGYHEFYQLCEYLGCDAMYVTSAGLVCSFWVEEGTEKDDFKQPKINIQDYIQDALDAIEYAIGPVDSKWGSLRAKNGHPKPFPLKYVEIGNEDFGPQYYPNYDAMYRAIHARYPQIKLIANSIVGQSADAELKRERIPQFVDPSTITIFDEHFYKDVPWVVKNYYKFDAYPRPSPDMFIGEMGIRGDYPLNLLGEAVFMMSMERNADLKPLMADRPLMRNWTFVKGDSHPLYFHTNSQSFKTFNYYMAKLFRDNTMDTWYHSGYAGGAEKDSVSMDYLFSTAGKDSKTGDLILKVVNLSAQPKTTVLSFKGVSLADKVSVATLADKQGLKNTPEAPLAIVPVTKEMAFRNGQTYSFAPKSLTVFRIKIQ